MTFKAVANEDMARNALGDDYDALAEPENLEADRVHPLWLAVRAALREVYDPEIPVNIYELGLIYTVSFAQGAEGKTNIDIKMTLTSPACPVAQEMPGMVQSAIFPINGVGHVDVAIVWDPTWNPGFMAETAKLQLNMFT